MTSISRFSVVVLLTLLLTVACSKDRSTPEEQLYKWVSEAEAAAEARSVSDIEDLMAMNYKDNKGQNREDALKLLRLYFFRNKNIHLLTRVTHIDIQENKQAYLVVLAGMAGVPIADIASIPLRLDAYRFELKLQEVAGEWVLVFADWRRVERDDFIGALQVN